MRAERGVHIGNDRGGVAAAAFSDFHHQLCERFGVLFGLHKRAAAAFYVQRNVLRARRKLFAHNA